MKYSLFLGACLIAVLCACGKQDASSATEQTQPSAAITASTVDTPQQAPAHRQIPAPQGHQPTTAEDIARIKAAGRSGLWSDPDAFCANARRQQATLSWNVEGKGVKRTTLGLVDKSGHERPIGQGGPIGRKTTGPWLKAGAIFILRDKTTKVELGKLTIAGKQC